MYISKVIKKIGNCTVFPRTIKLIQNTIVINYKFLSNPFNLQISVKFIYQNHIIFKEFILKVKKNLELNFHIELEGGNHAYIFFNVFVQFYLGIIWIFLLQTWFSTLTLFHFRIISCINNNYFKYIMVLNIFWGPDT